MTDAITPESWSETLLGSIIESAVDGPFGSNLKSEHYVDQPGTRVVRLQNIGISRFLDKDRAYVSSTHAAQLSRHAVEPGDLLVASLGDDAHPVARACQYPAAFEPAIVKADCFRLRLNKNLARHDFVRWLLNSDSARSSLLQRAQGVTRDRVNLTSLKRVPLRLPSLSEQQAIAEILDTMDESIHATERLIDKLCTYLVGLQDFVFSDIYIDRVCGAAEVDKVALANTGRWLSGGTPSTSNPNYWGGPIPWISAASLCNFYIKRSDRSVTIEGSQEGTRIVPPATVLFVVRGMSLKKEFRVGVTMRRVAFGQDCKAIIPNRDISAQYLAFALRSKESEVLRLADEAGHGTGRLETRLLKRMSLTLPRRQEDQQKLVRIIHDAENRLDTEHGHLTKLYEVKRGLMADLLMGRVAVKVD